MKRLTVILLVLLSLNCHAQWFTKDMAVRCSLMAVSGFADGTAEILRTDYSRFGKSANPNFWNPELSYVNKWKNGDKRQGERFPLSSTALVFTTDGYHLVRFIRNSTMIASICIPLQGRKGWKYYAVEVVTSYISYTIGFNIAYELVFK